MLQRSRASTFLLVLTLPLLGASAALAQGRPAGMADRRVKPPVTASVESGSHGESGDESSDALRQRLAERLRSKTEPLPGRPSSGGTTSAPRRKPAAAAAPEVHWGYVGPGAAEHWADLSPDNRLCASGSRQSPIDIREGIKVELEAIQFDYRPSGFAVVDNGHTVQVNVAPGNTLQVMGRRYELQQFHFHRPSEERINGRGYEMSVHLVHKDPEGRLAVVAVLLERGREQPLVQTIWNNLPLEKNEALNGPGLLDLRQLLPEDRGYYTYMGSLTTPPCSEGVLWMVMRQPVPVSPDQVAIFSRLYPLNARPVQGSAGRLIKESR